MATLKATYNGADPLFASEQIVDTAASQKRKALGTAIYGQDALYLHKAIEADEFLLEGAVGPMIEADMQAYEITAQEAVDRIRSARHAILQATKQIEVIRLRAKAQIRKTSGSPFAIARQAKADIENLPV